MSRYNYDAQKADKAFKMNAHHVQVVSFFLLHRNRGKTEQQQLWGFRKPQRFQLSFEARTRLSCVLVQFSLCLCIGLVCACVLVLISKPQRFKLSVESS